MQDGWETRQVPGSVLGSPAISVDGKGSTPTPEGVSEFQLGCFPHTVQVQSCLLGGEGSCLGDSVHELYLRIASSSQFSLPVMNTA